MVATKPIKWYNGVFVFLNVEYNFKEKILEIIRWIIR